MTSNKTPDNAIREIKFRAWNEHEGMQDIGIHLPNYVGAGWKIMQYTGLKDKNGTDVYEGDIVTEEGGHFVGEVQLTEYTSFGVDAKDEEHIGWVAFRKEDSRKQPLLELYKVEIIGNVWENKELLS